LEYIRTYEMENLITHYRDIQGTIQSILRDLEELSKGVDYNDTIATMALSRAPITDNTLSHTLGRISDKTGNVALKYQETLDEQQKLLYREITEEIFLLELILDKMNIALGGLTTEQKKLLEDKYWHGLDWTAIERKYLVSRTTGHTRRKEAIKTLVRISRISIKQYKQVMRILGL